MKFRDNIKQTRIIQITEKFKNYNIDIIQQFKSEKLYKCIKNTRINLFMYKRTLTGGV